MPGMMMGAAMSDAVCMSVVMLRSIWHQPVPTEESRGAYLVNSRSGITALIYQYYY